MLRETAISVRQARPADLPKIVSHYGAGDSPWDPFADQARLRGVPLQGLLVAEVGGQYAGFLYWFVGEEPWFDPCVRRYAHITEVQVLKNHRGQGIGRRLLAHALGRMRESGIEIVYIDTSEDNEVARRLYESAGFRPFSRTVLYKAAADEARNSG